jgi:zeta-carotene desaturase
MSPPSTVAVIGGGLAGLAAGCALADAGFRVALFERKPYLGGRASSYEHPGTGEVVDNCQHVLLGCCTALQEFYARIGATDLVRWYDRLHFLEPGGRASLIATTCLPAPLHRTPSFLTAKFLSAADKLAIARALVALMPGVPPDDGRPFLAWLERHGQTRRALDRFWRVVLVSALNEELDRIATPLGAMVLRESFLKSARGGRMGVPRVPLSELYSRAGDYIVARGGSVTLRAAVDELAPLGAALPALSAGAFAGPSFASRPGVRLVVDGAPRMFDYAVCAVPCDALARLLPRVAASAPLHAQLAKFETSPITGVHLWFDREITALDHAVLLDRTIQWMFQKSRILDRRAAAPAGAAVAPLLGQGSAASVPAIVAGDVASAATGSYLELVISASRSLVEKSRQEVLDLAVTELAEFFPEVRRARLVKATVVKEVHATFAPLPGSDAYRPQPATCWPQLFLAGDWIATGWPATMESAVRGGYLAAEALVAAAGKPQKFLPPELPAAGLMKWFG